MRVGGSSGWPVWHSNQKAPSRLTRARVTLLLPTHKTICVCRVFAVERRLASLMDTLETLEGSLAFALIQMSENKNKPDNYCVSLACVTALATNATC